MRKIVVLIAVLITAAAVITSCEAVRKEKPMVEAKLYFVDAQMMRLLPLKVYIRDFTPQKEAKILLNELIRGRDDNPKIRRIIPNIKNCMSVRVEGKTAYVNIKKEMVENHPDGRDLEILTVYSIVNSLTSIKEIETVRFTIDGKRQKDFKGFVDMRETFIPDYYV